MRVNEMKRFKETEEEEVKVNEMIIAINQSQLIDRYIFTN